MFLSSSLTVSISARFLKHILPAMLADIMQIVMLETAEPSRMKVYEDTIISASLIRLGLRRCLLASCGASSIDFSCCASKNLQNSSAKQKISVTAILGEHSGKGLFIIFLATVLLQNGFKKYQ